MRGVGPAVIGALAVSLVQMAPHAAPDVFTWCVLALTIAIMLFYKIGTMSVMAGGAGLGLLARGKAWELVLGLIR
jgi:chromate transporter